MTTRAKTRFKEVTAQQTVLFPSNLNDKIEANHPVRHVSKIVDQLNIDDILSGYKGGGTSSYYMRVMLKVLFYSYFCSIYSCRNIERLLHENIHFMWLSGNSTPNFRTINDFRGKRLKNKIQRLFAEMVRMMSDMGFVSLDLQCVDGAKLEAASNRYTFVWRGSVEKNKAKLEDKKKSVLEDIDTTIASDDQQDVDSESFENIDSAKLKEKIDELNSRLEELNKKEQ